MDDSHQPDEESTWASLSRREKTLAAFGMTGLALGVITAVLAAVLLGFLAVAAASLHLVEADGIGTLFWGVALSPSCSPDTSLPDCGYSAHGSRRCWPHCLSSWPTWRSGKMERRT
ncbi:hypothetical protein [Streptomyces sp. Ac-502]|uniref:hypothetical protein n=1 Tax=Streptomyces sp. Ac-502 TaxID=3342801 RepID=UPI003862CF2F